MSDAVIRVEGLSKRYRLGLKEKQAETLAGQIGNLIRSPWQNLKRLREMNRFDSEPSLSGGRDESVFWALKDINFEVKQGEVLGIIGKNGAGKSTLLKILSQITEPTSGKIEIHGRVASLLEVGTGFHPELSGRENIYMNGTILGMTRREIDAKLDEIIDFSGVEKFIDTPVKFYSSGMKVRLGFSVAAHLEPEILIIDEVLAVGDYEFQAKCLGKMEDVAGQGRTVLFVSHNMQAVSSLCSSCILLKNSRIFYKGSTDKSIECYLSGSNELVRNLTWRNIEIDPLKLLEFQLVEIQVQGGQPNLKLFIKATTKSYRFHKPCFFAVNILSLDGINIFQSIPQETPFIPFNESQFEFQVVVDLPPLIPGEYKVSVWAGPHYSETLDWKKNILQFPISESPILGRSYPFSALNGHISVSSFLK